LQRQKPLKSPGLFSSISLAVRLNVFGLRGGDPNVSAPLTNGHFHAVKIGRDESVRPESSII